jgi:hypothetical protein
MSESTPVYIIDAYCARRLLALLEQLHATVDEMLIRRRYEPRAPAGDLEALNLAALLANMQAEETDELF